MFIVDQNNSLYLSFALASYDFNRSIGKNTLYYTTV